MGNSPVHSTIHQNKSEQMVVSNHPFEWFHKLCSFEKGFLKKVGNSNSPNTHLLQMRGCLLTGRGSRNPHVRNGERVLNSILQSTFRSAQQEMQADHRSAKPPFHTQTLPAQFAVPESNAHQLSDVQLPESFQFERATNDGAEVHSSMDSNTFTGQPSVQTCPS